MKIKINGKIYYKLKCEKCGCDFQRRQDEIKKLQMKHNNKILCYKCCQASRYEDLKFKICRKCKKNKPIEEFYESKKGTKRHCSHCKECMNEYSKKWLKDNEEQVKKRTKKYREENREKLREMSKKWKLQNNELVKQYRRNTYYKNKDDLLYKLTIRGRHLIYKAFERKGYKKGSKTQEILGCDYETFINHLLNTYKQNYGYEWDGIEPVHIDHKTPLSTATTEDEVIKLNYYTNLQLLKELDNLHKSNKLNWKLEE